MKTRSLTYSLLTQTTTSFVRASPPARCSVKCRLLNNSNHRCSNSNHSNRRYNPSHSLALRLHSRYNRRITFSCNLNRVFYPLNSPFKFSMLRRLPCRKLHYHLRPPYPLLCSKAISQWWCTHPMMRSSLHLILAFLLSRAHWQSITKTHTIQALRNQ